MIEEPYFYLANTNFTLIYDSKSSNHSYRKHFKIWLIKQPLTRASRCKCTGFLPLGCMQTSPSSPPSHHHKDWRGTFSHSINKSIGFNADPCGNKDAVSLQWQLTCPHWSNFVFSIHKQCFGP